MNTDNVTVKLTPAQQEQILDLVLRYGQERADREYKAAQETHDRICKLVYGTAK